jgi:hypothetical protein
MLWLVISYRVTEPVGPFQSLPRFNLSSFSSYLCLHDLVVAFFPSIGNSAFSFASFALTRFRKEARYVIAANDTAEFYKLTDIPTAAAFRSGTLVDPIFTGNSSVDFSTWILDLTISASHTVEVDDAESLRHLLTGGRNLLLGIELSAPPQGYKNDIPFCSVPSLLFKDLGLSIRGGYHVYRAIDRQLIPLSGRYQQYLRSHLVDLRKVNFTQRPFLAGFLIDQSNETRSQLQFQVLTQIAKKFQTFSVSPIVDFGSQKPIVALSYLKGPTFVVWKDRISNQRWVVRGEKTLDFEFLEQYIERILRGTEPLSKISKMNAGKGELAAADFPQKVQKDAAILVHQGALGEFGKLFEKGKNEVKDFEWFTFDVTDNDIPEGFVVENPLPFVVVCPGGNVGGGVRYAGPPDFGKFLNFTKSVL